VSGEQNANLSETLSGQRPVFEMVDVVLRPFRPPTVLILDFFRKPNNTRKTGSSSSEENDSGSTESNKGATSGSSSNETENTFGKGNDISHIANRFDTRQDESIKSSSSHEQKQFSTDNEDKDDAQNKMGMQCIMHVIFTTFDLQKNVVI